MAVLVRNEHFHDSRDLEQDAQLEDETCDALEELADARVEAPRVERDVAFNRRIRRRDDGFEEFDVRDVEDVAVSFRTFSKVSSPTFVLDVLLKVRESLRFELETT
jgi:hypothetical protein